MANGYSSWNEEEQRLFRESLRGPYFNQGPKLRTLPKDHPARKNYSHFDVISAFLDSKRQTEEAQEGLSLILS